jgi:regulator of protease activity HflC (stomatin/prohibitin superfamily)
MMFIVLSIAAVLAFVLHFTTRNQIRQSAGGELRRAAGIMPIIGTLAVLAALSMCFTVIPAGEVGIIDFFGKVSDATLKSGINFVNPLARIIKMSIKTQELKEVMDVPSKEGLTVQLEISSLFHLNPEKAAEVYKTVGPNYVEIILEPPAMMPRHCTPRSAKFWRCTSPNNCRPLSRGAASPSNRHLCVKSACLQD